MQYSFIHSFILLAVFKITVECFAELLLWKKQNTIKEHGSWFAFLFFAEKKQSAVIVALKMRRKIFNNIIMHNIQ